MALADELQWRGFVNQTTFRNIDDVNEPRTLYWGVDPSADSMTIGHLAPAMMVRHFIAHGYKVVLLAGGATGMIGDPDGKKQERDLNSMDDIAKNKAAIAAQYRRIFDGQEFEIVDNYDWFKDMGYLDFLREVGKHASMTQMLDREFVQSRIGEGGSGISYAEFSYSLIQGYDFLHLYREKGVSLQVAGADQWGNSVTGVQLIRRLEGAEAHVWTTPLIINKSTGVKFGKSESGAIWLDDTKTSVYQFYQFWLNVDDESVIDYLNIFTLLDRDTIQQLAQQHADNPSSRHAQTALAFEVTKLIHGNERAEAARNVTATLFGGTKLEALSDDEIAMLAKEIPSSSATSIVELLVESKLAESKGQARRLLESGAISINGEKVDESVVIVLPSLVKKGRNSFVLVR